MTEFEVITLYLPANGKTCLVPNRDSSVLINQDCIEWLNSNCGPRANSHMEWVLGLPTNEHGWYYQGFEHTPASDFTKIARAFCFRNENHALMFKLAWGG